MAQNSQGTHYYHADGLGSIVALTDENEQIAERYSYSAFGKIKIQNGTIDNPYAFTGREWDEETGLYYYRARYYDPEVGRFLSEYPLGLQGGDINFYVYVKNNPSRFIDPSGLAYFAKRPLAGMPWLGPLSCDPADDFFNTEISHEQLFFEDGTNPSNIGFFDDGTLKTEPNPIGYRCRFGKFNDCIMRKAVARTVPLPSYCIIGQNCQTWAERVRSEYAHLSKNAQIRKECQGCE